MEWKKVPISSICEGIYEGPHATPPSCESGAYYLGIPALTSDGQIDFSKVPRICEKDYKKWTKRVTPKYGDIVFTNEATLNLYARIPMDFYGCLGRRLGLVRPLQDKVDVDYLFYYFFSPYWRKVIALKKVSGSTVERILMKKFPHFPVLLPPLNIQNKIASILSDYDNLIENNNKRIRLLEQMAENLYKEWFVRFRFPGHEKAEFENGLPKGWKREKIGKVYNTCSGGTPSRVNEDFYNNGSIPWVKTGELQDCLIHDAEEFITEDALKRSSAKLLPNHSLLMAMYGVNIGKLGILRKEMTCNQAVCAFLPKTADQTFYYLYFYLKGIRNYLLSISFGAAQQNLSQALIKNVRIMIPHNDTLQKFENKVSCYFDQISIYQRQNEQLSRQRDLLLPRLMSGKLEVNI